MKCAVMVMQANVAGCGRHTLHPKFPTDMSRPRPILDFLRSLVRFDTTSSSRHASMEAVFDRWGRLFSFLPFIVIVSVAPKDLYAAVWAALGIEIAIQLGDIYRSRYNPAVAFPNILNTGSLVCYVVLVILVYTVSNFDRFLIGPIVVSTMFGTVFASIVVGYPFTLQHTSHRVDEKTKKSREFYKFNVALSCVWLALFGIMLASIWIAYALFSQDQGGAGQIILGIVIPVLCPVLGFFLMPYVAKWLMGSGEKPIKSEEEDAPEGLDDANAREGLLSGSREEESRTKGDDAVPQTSSAAAAELDLESEERVPAATSSAALATTTSAGKKKNVNKKNGGGGGGNDVSVV